MSNEELLESLKKLKKKGIPYKFIANMCGIPIKSFYDFTHYKVFPYEEGQKVVDYITTNFSELLDQ